MLQPRLKIPTFLLFFIVVTLTLNACFDDPEFPDTPRIEFNNVVYKERTDTSPDSLIITIDFEDGDGDLGLSGEEDQPPYNERIYFSNKTGRAFNFQTETLEDLLIAADTAVIDTLPPFINNPLACVSWDEAPQITVIDGNGNAVPLDTVVYYQFNKRHNNIFVRFFSDQNNDGTIDEQSEGIDWPLLSIQQPPQVCTPGEPYDGRFPVLSDDLNNEAPLEGTITYSIVRSVPFSQPLGDGLIKIKVYIADRAGNFSNVVESPLFTLEEIRGN